MKKWEYRVEIVKHGPDAGWQWTGGTPEMLNLLGADGWELVCVAQQELNPQSERYESSEFYFKRETDLDLAGRIEFMKQEEEFNEKPAGERFMIRVEEARRHLESEED